MGNESFGNYIRRLRIEKNLPLRKVAAQLDIDTSTLSKVERGDRPISIKYLKPLSETLIVELKEIQVHFITDTIFKQLGNLEFIADGLNTVLTQMVENKE